MPLFMLTIQSCASKPKVEIIFPPRPQRIEQKEPQSMQDIAHLLNYYEHLVQQWELWGEIVVKMTSENP